MVESSALSRFVDMARTRLATDATHDDVLGELRRHGLEKIDSVRVLMDAARIPVWEAKHLVHHSPVWADHRDADEYVEERFWRALFIDCLVGRGVVNEPDELAAECRERQHQARTLMRDLAALLPERMVVRHREFMAEDLLGRAFAALVDAGRNHDVPSRFWAGLAHVADTLCLDELLGEAAPDAGADDFVHAAYLVRTLTNRPA